MRSRNAVAMKKGTVVALVFWLVLISGFLAAQDRLKLMPGAERFQKMSQEIKEVVKLGSLTVKWADDGKSFEYPWDGKLFRYDIAKKKAKEIGPAPEEQERRRRAGGPERGRQYTEAVSPDKKLKAFYRDRNLRLSDAEGKNEFAVTTDGNVKDRIKYGTASWVYGEELSQNTAMWWSPDSKKIAYYRFDESRVPDYFLQMD